MKIIARRMNAKRLDVKTKNQAAVPIAQNTPVLKKGVIAKKVQGLIIALLTINIQ